MHKKVHARGAPRSGFAVYVVWLLLYTAARNDLFEVTGWSTIVTFQSSVCDDIYDA